MVACPTDETLSALVERELDPVELDRVTGHLDTCAVCREIVVAAVRGGTPPALAAGTPSLQPTPPGLPPAARAARVRIGRYRLRALLGAGGMGEVHEAYDAELDRAIALKVLRPEIAGAVVLTERLVRESRLMAKVVHPAVITVYDVGRDHDAVFIAMELIRGETLGAHIARRGLTWRETTALYERAAHGLAAAHAAGIVHRDFKPDNVLVELGRDDRAARVVVTDFGIARLEDAPAAECAASSAQPAGVELTRTGTTIGTPAYMAPEQLEGALVDARADVFAFCVSLWQGVFGTRPFSGHTVNELRAAIDHKPIAPHSRVPGRLVRALERGLARNAADRWPDMRAFAAELAAIVGRRRRGAYAAAALGLVGVGIAGALALARPVADDPCAHGLDLLDRGVDAPRMQAVRDALAGDAHVDNVVSYLDDRALAWRLTQIGTCRSDREPIQPAATLTCLDARRTELAGVVDDIVLDNGRDAVHLAAEVGDPSRCVNPPPGLLTARVPADPVLRRRVTQLRHRLVAAEDKRDASDFAAAIAAERQIVADSATVWAPVHAEALYALGEALELGGDNVEGMRQLREAAAVAETSHHDFIALDAWMELATSATQDDGEPARGVEYASYAEAALERLGRPPELETHLLQTKGVALSQADRPADAEIALRRAVEIAERDVPDALPQAIESLGMLYGKEGRYDEAVAAYRRAVAEMPEVGRPVSVDQVVLRTSLAENLGQLGMLDEALAVARDAAARADRALADASLDRADAHSTLAEVLRDVGQFDAALAEARAVTAVTARTVGERSERYGSALAAEADALGGLHRYREADTAYERACDIIAFRSGEATSEHAECLAQRAEIVEHLQRAHDSLMLADQAYTVLARVYGTAHPSVAAALYVRGLSHADLGEHDLALADLEQSVVSYRAHAIAGGYLARSEWALAKLLWPRDRARAEQLLDDAMTRLGSPAWRDVRDAIVAWRATNR